MKKKQGIRKGLKKVIAGNVLALGLVSFCNDISSEMIYPLLPVFFTGIVPASATAVYLGLMDGIAESVSSILKIVSGKMSDASGKRKPLAVGGYGISALSRPFLAMAFSGWHVIFLRFCDRTGKGLRTSPRDALITESIDPEIRGMAFGFHRMMDHAGALIGPLLAGLILYWFLGDGLFKSGLKIASADEMLALRYLFAIAFIPALLALAALVIGVKEARLTSPSETRDSLITHGQGGSLPAKFYVFLTAVTLFALGNSSDLFIIFFAKTKFSLGLGYLIALWVGLHLSKMIWGIPGGSMSDRIGRRPLILAGWMIYILVYALMPIVNSLPVFWCLILVYGLYYGLTEGAEKALVADYSPGKHKMGTAYGLYHGAIGLAALPASLVFGVFWVELGPKTAFWVGASLAGAAMLVLLSIYKKPSSPD